MVYITSDLFGPNTAHEWQQDSSPNFWHTMSHEQPAAAAAASLGKRKRQANDDAQQQPHINHIPRQHRSSLSRETTRVHFPNGSSSTSTPLPFDSSNNHNNLQYAILPTKSHDYTSDRRPVKQLKRFSPPKAPLVKSTSHLMDLDIDAPAAPVCESRAVPAVSDLRSCHACNKAPKRKKDLENYLDCRRCEGRTCFICARQCVGCDKAICKKCIVEVGEEGDAWCLDCYSRNINS